MIDASADDDEQDRQRVAVEQILGEIGASEVAYDVVLNKIDQVDPLGRRRLANRFPGAAQVSSVDGEGLDDLRASSRTASTTAGSACACSLPYEEGGKLSELYALGTPIEEREDTAEGVALIARLPRRDLPRFAAFLVAESSEATHRESA